MLTKAYKGYISTDTVLTKPTYLHVETEGFPAWWPTRGRRIKAEGTVVEAGEAGSTRQRHRGSFLEPLCIGNLHGWYTNIIKTVHKH